MPDRRVTAGQQQSAPPTKSAAWINGVSAMLAAWKRGELGGKPTTGTGKSLLKLGDVKVRNDSTGNRAAGEVLQLGAAIADPEDYRNIWFAAALPADPAPSARLAVLVRPCEQNEIGEARVDGICLALVNVLNTSHRYAAGLDASAVLESADSGPAEILSPVESTGDQILAIRLGLPIQATGYDRIYGLATADFAYDDPTGTIDHVQVRKGDNPLTNPEDENETIVGANDTGHECKAGDLIKMEWDPHYNDSEGRWTIYDGPCHPDEE